VELGAEPVPDAGEAEEGCEEVCEEVAVPQ